MRRQNVVAELKSKHKCPEAGTYFIFKVSKEWLTVFREKPKIVLHLTLKELYWSKLMLLNGSQSARPFETGCSLNIFQMAREKN